QSRRSPGLDIYYTRESSNRRYLARIDLEAEIRKTEYVVGVADDRRCQTLDDLDVLPRLRSQGRASSELDRDRHLLRHITIRAGERGMNLIRVCERTAPLQKAASGSGLRQQVEASNGPGVTIDQVAVAGNVTDQLEPHILKLVEPGPLDRTYELHQPQSGLNG